MSRAMVGSAMLVIDWNQHRHGDRDRERRHGAATGAQRKSVIPIHWEVHQASYNAAHAHLTPDTPANKLANPAAPGAAMRLAANRGASICSEWDRQHRLYESPAYHAPLLDLATDIIHDALGIGQGVSGPTGDDTPLRRTRPTSASHGWGIKARDYQSFDNKCRRLVAVPFPRDVLRRAGRLRRVAGAAGVANIDFREARHQLRSRRSCWRIRGKKRRRSGGVVYGDMELRWFHHPYAARG